MSGYYSEEVSGPRTRTKSEFDERSWGGIIALVRRGIATGVFAEEFPELCPDGRGVYATDERSLRLAILAEHPTISWPLDTTNVPDAPAVLDLLEFLHSVATDAAQGDFHRYYEHYHLEFNQALGRRTFREQVNRIFARNGLAYELQENGRARRLLEPMLQAELHQGLPGSGDARVDALIRQAEERFLDPDPTGARDALEKLWDAFERIKTVLVPHKRRGSAALIAAATSTAESAELVETEMRALTEIGNKFHIRHHETTSHPVPEELIDYLFLRMYTQLRLLIAGLGNTA